MLRSHSFAMYTKEYDVFTGDLKQRFDETRLRNEEAGGFSLFVENVFFFHFFPPRC